MKVSIIVAMDKNQVIGKDNKLPWRLPRELQYVKKTTMGCPIIMGRKNYESIGRPLPGRRNIILTREKDYSAEGCEIVHSVEDVFKTCEGEEEIFIFGGEQIYRLFLPYTEKLYITKIHYEFEGDTFFPEIDWNEWEEVSSLQGITDEKNPYTYYFHVYERACQ
ncbi:MULTISPECIES: dihydrofolate reductase [Bacillus]|uniref:Dihydrofolate reductase n=2 Tax=Bacillus TaxID=1386 RepID=A0A0M5JBE5_9BACI|nr:MULTISPECIES: dihydrofolate reductase [Bacillus]ALC81344.1 dihydrofolate reductase [Bacillus gobiensis]MBP1080359.1 dihydrofolate reductase [Bacillus capparidis]MED1094222.1 dihydrofolate reductase [Bacillus capparidis]